MGYLLDVITGKIGLQNVLLTRNVENITKRINNYPQGSFTHEWSILCVYTIFTFLLDMFFKDKSEFTRYLRKNIKRLDERKANEIFKLLAGFHLYFFLNNISTDAALNDFGIEKNDFVNEILLTFGYSPEDMEYFKENFKKYDPSDLETIHYYCIDIYERILKIFNVPDPINIYSDSDYFGRLLADQHIHVFLKALKNRFVQ